MHAKNNQFNNENYLLPNFHLPMCHKIIGHSDNCNLSTMDEVKFRNYYSLSQKSKLNV